MRGNPIKRMMFMRDHRWTGAHASEYIDGELSEGDRRRLERHAGMCPECRRMLATLRRTLRELTGLQQEQPPSVADSVIDRLRRSW